MYVSYVISRRTVSPVFARQRHSAEAPRPESQKGSIRIGYPCESNSCNDSGHGDDDFENGHVDDGDGDRLDDAHGRAGDRALARVCVRVIAEDGKVIVSDDDHDDDEDDGDDDGDKLRKVMVKVAGTFLDVDRDEAKTNICV